MTRAGRWLPLVPVGALCVAYAAVSLIPGRSRRAERIAGAIIVLGAAAMLAAFALEAYTRGGLTDANAHTKQRIDLGMVTRDPRMADRGIPRSGRYRPRRPGPGLYQGMERGRLRAPRRRTRGYPPAAASPARSTSTT